MNVAGIRKTAAEDIGCGGAVARSQYLIDRFRVVFESGGGWHCVCADFVSSNTCGHTREAAGRRAAQTRIAERLAAGRSEFAGAVPRRLEIRRR